MGGQLLHIMGASIGWRSEGAPGLYFLGGVSIRSTNHRRATFPGSNATAATFKRSRSAEGLAMNIT